ncbi:MAG: energy transducer TonB [Bacteroidaceae bacterium]|nr:energy transducer TonB [Bacteroidaceae bacterium]MBQ2459660.1 energy transducer TonB [Bacteroidaceae bacterium]MBQ2519482.1 energy transducer TonB [Bacteroidaceae bacterium]MBQ3957640.1 energy transducer TonB [Bacteroidaceae bacterium]MBQ3992248.1 energy transducer TonB [Bacteroidaceae bacterium]
MDNTAKTENVDLRAQKSTNLLMGYVLALAAMFVAFEYTQREVKVVETDKIYEFRMEEDMIPITQQQETVAPPPAAAPTVMEIINEVEDDTELPEEEVETTEEVNQAITTVVGTGAPSAMVATGPVGPVVEADDDDRIFDIVEENAQFPGGDEACFKWLSEHIKYPSICQEQGVQGRVIVSFVVNKDGSIVDVKTLRSPDSNLSKEAERVVKLMPKWKPARQGNKTVRSRFNLPVLFRLN